jgi:DNA-binding transcriptional ArsR family regulator
MVEHSATALDATYAALGHDVRRRMLEDLRDGQARVTDLAEPFEMSLAAASKHIFVLERAGLVQRTIAGREHLISLRAAPLAPASEWLESYRRFWTGRLDALERHLRERER